MPKILGNVRRVDPQFRLSIPDEVRHALQLQPGDFVQFTVEGSTVKLRKARLMVT